MGDMMINVKYLFHFNSCGYYCLKHISKNIKIKRKGYMSLFELKKILCDYNYSCLCFKVDDLKYIKDKCITLVKKKNSYHYIIICKIFNNFVYVYDPLFLFVRKIKKDKFIKWWSGICLSYVKI